MNAMEYIRNTYNVPAKRGGRITFHGKPGRITGARGAYILARLDGYDMNHPVALHPTDHIEYIAKAEQETENNHEQTQP